MMRFNPFLVNNSILCPLQIIQTFGFLVFLGEYKRETLTINGLVGLLNPLRANPTN